MHNNKHFIKNSYISKKREVFMLACLKSKYNEKERDQFTKTLCGMNLYYTAN